MVFIVYSIDPKCNLLNPEKKNETPRVFDVFFLFFVQKQKATTRLPSWETGKNSGTHRRLLQTMAKTNAVRIGLPPLFIIVHLLVYPKHTKLFVNNILFATIDGILACLKVVLGVCCVCMCIDIYILYYCGPIDCKGMFFCIASSPCSLIQASCKHVEKPAITTSCSPSMGVSAPNLSLC